MLQSSNQRIVKVELAIERETKKEKNSKKKIRIKKRNKKVPTEISVSLKKKHHKKKFGTKVELLLKEHLGETDAVTEVQKGNKRSFCYKCPECKKIIIEKLSRHLEISHKYTHYDATMLQSKMRVMFLWCRAEKHGQNLPLPCKSCGQWQTRLDQHLARNTAHQLFTKQEEIKKIVNELRKECWEKGTRQEKIEVQNATSVQEASNENENAFVTRATYSTIPSAPPSNDYLPPSANWITPELRKKWEIKYEDFFTIFYKDADELLDAFQEELCGSGHERDNAVQHRNQV